MLPFNFYFDFIVYYLLFILPAYDTLLHEIESEFKILILINY